MTHVRRVFAPVLLLALAGVAAACSNPVGGERHATPEGIVVRQGSTLLVRSLGGQVTGALTVTEGDETAALTVRFLEADGDEIVPESGYWLKVTAANGTVAQWVQTPQGEFGGVLRGLSPGSTQLTFELMHGAVGAGHPDFTISLTATVTAREL